MPPHEIDRQAPPKAPLNRSTLPCFRGDPKLPKTRSLDKHGNAPKLAAKQTTFIRGSVSINRESIRESWIDAVRQLPCSRGSTTDIRLKVQKIQYMHLREKRNRKQNSRFLGDEWEKEADFLGDKSSSSGDGVDQCGPRGKRNRKQNGKFLGDEWENEANSPSHNANSDGSSQLYSSGSPGKGAVVHSGAPRMSSDHAYL